MFGDDPAVPSDQECDRQSQNSAIEFTCFCIAHHNRVVHFEALVEIAHRCRSVVHGNTNDLHAVVPVLVLQFDEMWNLVTAWIAPGCPEIQKNDLASIGRQFESLSR